jgi:hypothetical protein
MFDNAQFWIWLIVIVITLIARANKKKQQQSEHDQPEFGGPQESKPISFEDLLREIQASKAPVVTYEKFKGYKRERQMPLAGNYVKELRNPTSFKRAFILSEILTKKY